MWNRILVSHTWSLLIKTEINPTKTKDNYVRYYFQVTSKLLIFGQRFTRLSLLVLPTWKICVYFIRERQCIRREMFAFLIPSNILRLPCVTRRRNLLFYQCYFCLFEFLRDLPRNAKGLNAIYLRSREIIT